MFYPREAERDNLVNRVILLTIACCVALAFAAMARAHGVVYAAIHLSPIEVMGTVTQVEDIPHNSSVKMVHYRYTDHDQRTHDDEYWDPRYDEHTPYAVGDSLALVYARWFPQVSNIANERQSYRPSFIIMAGGCLLAVLFLGMSFRTLGRLTAMKREDRFY
jgi:hypothetical protein